ncbi:hypothetical protein NDU88_005149 [Pleurodeles waltl]|uniref:Uncharacterized protein n=1 Tax=Pleurodeles waltl TaxID=8319 RepID=A0AAV7VK86_PLEWA|nr:hypothetical protein NDU88_005149 [Pleurodeles waltl]
MLSGPRRSSGGRCWADPARPAGEETGLELCGGPPRDKCGRPESGWVPRPSLPAALEVLGRPAGALEGPAPWSGGAALLLDAGAAPVCAGAGPQTQRLARVGHGGIEEAAATSVTGG